MQKNKAANHRVIYSWLFLCCSTIFIMVILGGLTRLTNSGLSIMKWEPVSGAIPPLTTAKWQEYFNAYKQIPQYEKMNKGMSLSEFQGIFWLEYFHRLMGRLAGIVFFVPFIYFLIKKQLSKRLIFRSLVILALGGLQGFIGWYMVSSGFAQRTEVSQYRLMIHLGMAFLMYAYMYWTGMDVKYGVVPLPKTSRTAKFALVVSGMIYFMVLLGALMAGTRAGFTYNTFPLMDGRLIPENLYVLSPWWLNHFENITMIQFQHRLFACITAVMIFILANKIVRRDFDNVVSAIAIIFSVIVQIALGISTLYSFGSYADYDPVTFAYMKVLHVPVIIAALHQLNALVLFTISLRISHKLYHESGAERLSYVI